ncbi:MAG: ATP-binding protein [Desulfobacteraceae bacterium]|jgi:hypothetical protein
MSTWQSLSPEWKRIDLLCAFIRHTRQGGQIDSEQKQLLISLQHQVVAVRRALPWEKLIQTYGLTDLDQDIIAGVVAPEASARVGWLYQEFQPGIASSYPTPALLQELLFLDENDPSALLERLQPNAPIAQSELVMDAHAGYYRPIYPSDKAGRLLLGRSFPSAFTPPGTIAVQPYGRWKDLVLPKYCLEKLEEFLLWITHKSYVIQHWGARITGGPVALFTGPSGTGKTFAAEAIANEMACPLYRVDLGLLVSKYIGETEKNLNALFDAVAGKGCILLFDEADSLFGKRAQVKDARDRYANMEVSHLLTRIERHNGPCILTSNLRRHLDPAFARRFQMVVDFPKPDASARTLLWQKYLPPKAPLAREVDLNVIGSSIDLTPGQIRNAALHAAFLAAGESMPIALKHIAGAVWTEFAKEGREIMRSKLGPLAAYHSRGGNLD